MHAGMTTTRLSAIERGEVEPSALDRELLERAIPDFQGAVAMSTQGEKIAI